MISPALSCRSVGVEIARILEVKGFVGTATSTEERIGHDIRRKQATENLASTKGARKFQKPWSYPLGVLSSA